MGSAAGKHVREGSSGGNSGTYRRKAHHAGSWYEDTPKALHQSLDGFLAAASQDMASSNSNNNTRHLRAVIVPHAGYSYSGPTAAYSYDALQQALSTSTVQQQQQQPVIEHILVLHPAHHVHLQGCAVSGATVLETPLGNLPVDDDIRNEILALSSNFTVMAGLTDNEEHSGEMQYPYLAKLLLSPEHKEKQIRVLPIMCGALSTSQEASFGKLLSTIIARPNVLCVISSDFCHWGSRFRFQPTTSSSNGGNSGSMPIHEFIREMDHKGMDLIALQKPGAFADYLKETRNTICGRHAISVWLQAIDAIKSEPSLTVDFVKYAQSSAVSSMGDSSVSYASAVVTAAAPASAS